MEDEQDDAEPTCVVRLSNMVEVEVCTVRVVLGWLVLLVGVFVWILLKEASRRVHAVLF